MERRGIGWSASAESISSLCREIASRELEFLAPALLVVLGFVVISVLVFRKFWVRQSLARDLSVKICLAVSSLAILSLVIEILMYGFHSESVGWPGNITGRRWFCEHWHPINDLGYRDEGTTRLFDKHTVVVLGDSFAAGHGVEDYRDRFSNRLEGLLGSDWAVANVARLGWHTADQQRGLAEFPYDPEIVVISYYVNDIMGVAPQRQMPGTGKSKSWPPPLQYLVDHSTLWNYASLKAGRFRSKKGPRNSRFQKIVDAFDDPATWARHERELRSLISQIRSKGAQPIVVTWPYTRDVERTAPLTGRVADLMRTADVPVIDLADHFAGREPAELMASSMDGHPSRGLHEEVAELLYERLRSIDRGYNE
ncbi:MAG: SGNH/GDSL hydrolase family protein [Deltaproteobacteria bacterium]|nr:SGNH/GDSL hydrolase family protein [Deltaproteobacteria bacterium]MBW2723672.1 SGNH/GDSL hydrolase family protein [Deltaproteobacteria bacterium]